LNEENITGYIFRQTVFEKLAEESSNLKLKDIRRNISVIHGSKPLLGVWETLLERKDHIALVVDEYGGMDGIVTMEDIIETLLGFEIVRRERYDSRYAAICPGALETSPGKVQCTEFGQTGKRIT